MKRFSLFAVAIQKSLKKMRPSGALRPSQGFTLMEVMVAVSIFAIVVTVGIVALLTINNSYRKSQTERQAIDSLTYTLESMSRRIRTAASWDPSMTFGQAASSFKFDDQDGITVTYHWSGITYGANGQPQGKILMDVVNPATQGSVPTIADGLDYSMTPDNVVIKNLSFMPLKASGMTGQSYVQINIQGTVTNGRQVSDFSFQTGVSKRVLDQ